MHLYIKQKVFSWADSFSVMDVNGTQLYSVVGKIFSINKKLVIYQNNSEVARIEQKIFSLLPRFFVYKDGQQIAEIKKHIAFLREHYSIDGLGWEIQGDLWNHDYSIICGGRTISTIHKKWLSWGDAYELNIDDGVDQITALAVILAIDCVAAQKD